MLELTNVSKAFGAVHALNEASLTVRPGEIRALLGANGSGKSTMVKILSGLVRRDTGTVTMDGRKVQIRSPRDSRVLGIAAAYQDLSLIPRLPVAENIMLGNEPTRRGVVDERRVTALAEEYLRQLNTRVNMDALAMDLDSSTLSIVEIAKALSRQPKVLLLDEVTASLRREQVKSVFTVLKKLRDEGMAIVFVSHRLDEVFELCDTATILRGGKSVAEVHTGEVEEHDLVYHMTGMKVSQLQRSDEDQETRVTEEVLLEVRDLRLDPKVQGVSFSARKGQIIGIGGLQGQGQEELLRAVYGYLRPDSGEILIDGESVRFKSAADAVRHGFGFIPGDREREGIFPVRPIIDNIYMAEFAKQTIAAPVSPGVIADGAEEMVKKLSIKIGSASDQANSLSGGNQQKLVVGRWLKVKPRVLLLDDPTKGVDVTSRLEIHTLLRRMAQDGTAIIISSSENEELLDLADTILVFYEGRIVDVLRGEGLKEERLVSAMLGVKK